MIKEIREKVFMTMEEFADELGVSLQTVFKWEHGYCPSKKSMRKIIQFCRKYQIKINKIF